MQSAINRRRRRRFVERGHTTSQAHRSFQFVVREEPFGRLESVVHPTRISLARAQALAPSFIGIKTK